MNWRLLDIRVGRANRGQLIVVFLFTVIASSLYSQFLPMFLYILFDLAFSYLNIVISARRFRDLGYSGIYAALPVAIILPVLLLPEQLANFLVIIPLIIIGIIGLIQLIIAGNSGPNKYGNQPRGLDFESMVSDIDPADILEKPKEFDKQPPKRDLKYSEYKQENKDTPSESFEFKGRD